MSNHKKNIILFITSIFFCSFIIEAYSYVKVNEKLKYGIGKLGNKRKVNSFINSNIKSLHHLRRHTKIKTDNLSTLIYNKVGKGNKKVLIQGDSWAELIERDPKNIDLLLDIPDTQFLLAGTSSYSPSLMSAQLNVIRSQFGESPETIIAIIDQTDLGDELCRYKNLREVINGKVVVRPDPPGTPEHYTLHSLFSKHEVLKSNLPFTIRLIKYELLTDQIVDRMKNSKRKCNYNDILGILKNNISDLDLLYWDYIFTEYINNVFSNSDLKHFIIVTHPHKYHLNGEYVSNINDLIINNVNKSRYKDKITVLDPSNYYKNDGVNIEEIFIVNDSYSHLKPFYITNYYLPKIIQTLINLHSHAGSFSY
tara:strand:+ start:4076 stop:5173 length:1098 start_codon:yes stop_codon:yes gene_type:complete